MKVSGFDLLDRRLARLERALADDKVRSALRAGGEIIADEQRRIVPVDTGLLRDSIAVVDDRDARIYGTVEAADVSVYVGPVGSTEDGDVFYARFIEFGTSQMPAQPFLRPAYAAKRDEAGREVARRLGNLLSDAAR